MRCPTLIVNQHCSPSLLLQVHIINLLQDSKFQHFKPVMDTYIESHFAGALSYRYVTFHPLLLALWGVRVYSSAFSIKYLSRNGTAKGRHRQHERPIKVGAERQLHSALCFDLVTTSYWRKGYGAPWLMRRKLWNFCCLLLPLPLLLLSITSMHMHTLTTSCCHQMSPSHSV